MRVVKRDGTVVQFSDEKIRRGIVLAADASQVQGINSVVLMNRICDQLLGDPVHVDSIGDTVERVLMNSGWLEVAKCFILYRSQKRAGEARRLVSRNGCGIAEYIHAAKYAAVGEEGVLESFDETVSRVEGMHLRRYKDLGSELEALIRGSFDAVREKLVLPSMRSMQFAGKAIERNHCRMYNCAFTLCDRPEVFGDIFYLLLCGCGVGYSVQWRHIESLPTVADQQSGVTHFRIPDTIEGWADSVKWLVAGAYGGKWVEFDYSKIRPEGSLLHVSGGRAPGHLPLRRALEACRGVLLLARGRKLRPIEVHDILCHLAEAVLSGGIRRSSLISLFSVSDTEMLYSKARGNYDPSTGLAEWRAMANNSAVLQRGVMERESLDRVLRVAEEGFGEPGFLFTNSLDTGTNPCGEIGLDPRIKVDGVWQTGFSFCNLTEVNVAKCESGDDLNRAARHAATIGTLQAGYSEFPYIGNVSRQLAARDRLLGVGLTGIMDRPAVGLSPNSLRNACSWVREANHHVAGLLGIAAGRRLTCVKPSGTASLELGCVGSGVHPHHARRYFRRVTCNQLEGPFQTFREVNPHMVEQKSDRDYVIMFPVQPDDGALIRSDLGAIEFLTHVATVYKNWVLPGTKQGEALTHNVSTSCEIRDAAEREQVVDWIWANRGSVAALSFVPAVLDKQYPFAPREEVVTRDDERIWNNLVAGYRVVDWKRATGSPVARNSVPACEGPRCDLGL